MFCPKCATQNLEGVRFCRVCGANISLVPQALTGQMVQPQMQMQREELYEEGRRRRGKPLTLEAAFKNMFMGVAFLIVSIALSRSIGAAWWFWMLIPAFSLMGTGVAQFVRVKERDKRAAMMPQQQMPSMPPMQSAPPPVLPRRTDELHPPVPSVTEGTTRHLGVEAPTRHLETQDRK
jgi:zinc ribbon protein